MHIAKWAILLSVFWLLLSGFIQPLLLSFGAISVAIVLVVLRRMDMVDEQPRQISSGHQMMRYMAWLLREIFKSSLHVAKLVWSSPDKVSPTLAKINAQKVDPKYRVLYANSITLTPGTLSVDLQGDEITVHALEEKSIEELKQGEIEKKITGIWGEHK